MSGGAAVVESLRNEGVTHVFGVVGTALLEVTDNLVGDAQIRYVGVRHEQNAAHMADAYGRVRGRAGVVLAGQPGPGATNLVSGIALARAAFSPVVAIAGYPMTSHLDREGYQEVDQHSLFAPLTKKTSTVYRADRIPEYLRDAFRLSQAGRQGPVVLNIPSDLLGESIEVVEPELDSYQLSSRAAPSRLQIENAAKLIEACERPLIIAGAGVKWARASAALEALAERLDAPIVASAGHGDVVDNDHSLYLGHLGPRGNEYATEAARSADLILAIGTRLGFNTTLYTYQHLAPAARIIQVDIEASAVGRFYPVAVGMVADAGETLNALLEVVAEYSARPVWRSRVEGLRGKLLLERERLVGTQSGALLPSHIAGAIQRVAPRDLIVTLDTGTCCLQVTDLIRTFQTPSLLTPLDFGLVGFSFAAGLGAKAAAPERPVVSLMGDGAFSMTNPELGTALSSGLPTTVIVMNNGSWGAEKAYQRDYYSGRFIGTDLENPPFDEIARAWGADGVGVATQEDLTSAVSDAVRSNRPTVIDVAVDPEAITSFRRDTFAHRRIEED